MKTKSVKNRWMPKRNKHQAKVEKIDIFPKRASRPFGFLRRLFGRKKYELALTNNIEDSNTVSTVSYKKHNMDFLENHDINGRVTVFHAPEPDVVVNEKLMDSVGKLLKERRAKDNAAVSSKSRIGLMNVIEKTFTQQLDIFKGLLDMAESNTLERNICRKVQQMEWEGKKVDDFVKDLVGKLVLQLHQDTSSIVNLNSARTTCQKAVNKNDTDSSCLGNEQHGGDNASKKEIEITCECECNVVTEFGPATPAVGSELGGNKDLMKNDYFNLE